MRMQRAQYGHFEVSWSKIIPPLRNTMRFVYRKKADIHIADSLAHEIAVQSFWRKVQELHGTIHAIIQRDIYFTLCHSRKNRYSLYAPGLELFHLIPHQRYERRNNDANSL